MAVLYMYLVVKPSQKTIFLFLGSSVNDLCCCQGRSLNQTSVSCTDSVNRPLWCDMILPTGTCTHPHPVGADDMSDLISDNVLVPFMTSLLIGTVCHKVNMNKNRFNDSYTLYGHFLFGFYEVYSEEVICFMVHFTDSDMMPKV